MTFLTPLGLIALLGIPTVLLLHLFRQRRKKRAVSGIFLFGGDITVVESGRQPLPLEATASLILELLAALLLALILSGLSCRGEPDHVVIVLDQSASMGALTPSGSIADAARTEALRVVAETGRSVRVSLVLTGKAPVVAVGPRALAPLLEPALQRYEPTAVHHAMAPALELARQTASPGTPIVLITDTAPESPIPGVAVHAVGTPLANAAIRSAFRSVGPAGREHVIVDVGGTSPGNAVVRTRVAILSGEGVAATPLAARDVLVPRGGAATVSIEVTASPKALTVRLSPDALAIDNTALLLPIETRLLTVQDELPEAFSKAIELNRALAATGLVAPPGPDADTPGLVIRLARGESTEASAPAPTPVPGEPAEPEPPLLEAGLPELGVELVVHPLDPDAEGALFVAPFLIDGTHPLADGLGLDGSKWAAGTQVLPGRPLIEAGGTTLLSVEETAQDLGVRVHLQIAPQVTTLFRTQDWPVLLANISAFALSRLPGPGPRERRVGEALTYRRAPSEGPLRWERPDGETQIAESIGPITRVLADHVGLYRLIGEDGQERARYSVRFGDGRESDVSTRGQARVDAAPAITVEAAPPSPAPEDAAASPVSETPGPPETTPSRPGAETDRAQTFAHRPLRPYLGLLLLLVIAADWFVLAGLKRRRA